MQNIHADMEQAFLRPDFSARAYANAIIEAQSDPHTAGSSSAASAAGQNAVTLALSRLNIALDDIGRMIKEEVTASAADFVAGAQDACKTEEQLAVLCQAVSGLQQSTKEMKLKVSKDYRQLERLQLRTEKLQEASRLIRDAVRFIVLCRRLDMQVCAAVPFYREAQQQRAVKAVGDGSMDAVAEAQEDESGSSATEDAAELPKAAATLRVIEELLEPASPVGDSSSTSITGLHIVQQRRSWLAEVRQVLTERMEDLVVQGLKDLSLPLLGASLQTAVALGGLPELVQDLLADLTDVVRERTRAAFDTASLAREAAAKGGRTAAATYTVRQQQQSTPEQDARYNTLLWRRLQTLLVHEMSAVCKKVYTLEKALKLQTKGAASALSAGDSIPSETSGRISQPEKSLSASEGKTLLDDALTVLGDKPSLLFWRTLAESFEVESQNAMRASSQFRGHLEQGFIQLLQLFQDFFSQVALYTDTVYTFEKQSPEASMLMTRLSALSRGYVARVASRLDDAASTAFSSRNVPGAAEGSHFARLLCKELEQCKDPLLLPSLVKCASAAATDFFDQLTRLRNSSPLNLAGGQNFSGQLRNADLASAAHAIISAFKDRLEAPSPALRAFLQSSLPALEKRMRSDFSEPFLDGVHEQLRIPISRMEYAPDTNHVKSASPFVADLSDRIALLRDSILPKYQTGPSKAEWLRRITERCATDFLAQLKKLEKESLQSNARLSADLDALRIALSQLIATSKTQPALELDALPAFVALSQFVKRSE